MLFFGAFQSSLAFDRGGQTGPPRSNAFFFGAVDDKGTANDRPSGHPTGRSAGRTLGRTPPAAQPNEHAAAWPRSHVLTRKIGYDYSEPPLLVSPIDDEVWHIQAVSRKYLTVAWYFGG